MPLRSTINLKSARLPVLAYHDVSPRKDLQHRNLTVSPESFERQIHWLVRHGFKGLTCADVSSWMRAESELPDKSILLTFDDAYANLTTYAFPLLKALGFPASVFVITGRMGECLEWDQRLTMSPQQVQDWSRQGIEFGAHSRTHPDFRVLPLGDLDSEVRGSRDDLEKLLGCIPAAFAYPFGAYNQSAMDAVGRSFELGLSLEEGLNTRYTDRMLIRRTEVLPFESLTEFSWRVRFGYHPLRRLRMKAGIRTRFRSMLRVFEP